MGIDTEFGQTTGFGRVETTPFNNKKRILIRIPAFADSRADTIRQLHADASGMKKLTEFRRSPSANGLDKIVSNLHHLIARRHATLPGIYDLRTL